MCTQHIAKYMLTLCLLAPRAVCKQFRHRSGSAWTCGCIVIFCIPGTPPPPGKVCFRKKSGIPYLDPDQVLHFVGPDLGSNVLQMFSVDDDKSKVLMYTGSVVEKVLSESL